MTAIEIQNLLREKPTRLLLRLLEDARIEGVCSCPTEKIVGPDGITRQHFADVSYPQIKAELATREHIPNKIESKAIRRTKARRRQ